MAIGVYEAEMSADSNNGRILKDFELNHTTVLYFTVVQAYHHAIRLKKQTTWVFPGLQWQNLSSFQISQFKNFIDTYINCHLDIS